MKLSVIEAMRLKNELSSEIGKLQYTRRGVSYGESFEGGERVDDLEMTTIVQHMERAKVLLNMALEINDKLDSFNKDNKISNSVRKIKNNQLLLAMWNSALGQSETSKGVRKVQLDSKIEKVSYEFKPHLSKVAIRKTQKELKSMNRELQSEIDKANSQLIEISFEYSEFEDLCSVE